MAVDIKWVRVVLLEWHSIGYGLHSPQSHIYFRGVNSKGLTSFFVDCNLHF